MFDPIFLWERARHFQREENAKQLISLCSMASVQGHHGVQTFLRHSAVHVTLTTPDVDVNATVIYSRYCGDVMVQYMVSEYVKSVLGLFGVQAVHV